MAATATDRLRVLSPDEVGRLIADGQTITIIDGFVVRVDAWLSYHPGGKTVIQHMIGRDATDEFNVFHSVAAKKRMERFRIGRVDGQWVSMVPPIQGGRYDGSGAAVDSSDESSTVASSAQSSVDLDEQDGAGSPRARLGRAGGDSMTSSVSSVSSDADEKTAAATTSPLLGVLDARTERTIRLDLATYPSLEAGTQQEIVRKYRVLLQEIEAQRLYECNYWAYLVEACRYALLFGLFVYSLRCGAVVLSGAFLGLFWHQLVFTAHDAGHMGITHHYATDTFIGIVVADFLGGLSLGWWKRSHNIHHVVTNMPEHDPDIELLPFFAISHRFFQSLRSTYYDRVLTFDAAAQLLVPYQHLLYYPVLALGRFNLYLLSWAYLATAQAHRKGPAWWHRWLEIAGQLFFWAWFGYAVLYRSIPSNWDRVVFVLVSHAITMPLHVQITLSHFAMSTADLGAAESFPQKMLRTTMDVDCPPWLDFIHGGLQFQAVHHLFPRLPRHNLRRAQKLVMRYCDDVAIPYARYGFVDGNKKVLSHLQEIGRQATILAQCQQTIASTTTLH